MKTFKLSGDALRHAVMLAEGWDYFPAIVGQCALYCRSGATPTWTVRGPDYLNEKAGDDIIDREKIETCFRITDSDGNGYWVAANLFTSKYGYAGATRREAAMRCHVASQLGDDLEIPKEMQ